MPRSTQYPHRSLHRFAVVVSMVAFALFASPASAAILPVGPGGGTCTYSTIQAAINAASSGDSITVADAGANYTEKLTITDKSLGISSCPCNHQVCLYDTTHNLLTNVTLSGAGGANAPVLKIVTTNANNPITVSLDRLTIQDGHSGSTDGGGISFSGVGALNLMRTNVTSNTANYGAGINFKANGGNATLTINHDTFITYNTAATSGGGIRVEGVGATLNVNAANTWISQNEATTGLGGGLEIINSANAFIGSPGYLFGGVIYENTATNGGGIALSGTDSRVTLFSTDPLHPVSVDNNTAYAIGGALYQNGGVACMQNVRLTNNIAQNGTAIYGEGGGDLLVNHAPVGFSDDYDQYCGNDQPSSVPCDASVACNVVDDNIAENVKNGNAHTDGAAIFITSGRFEGTGLKLRGNQGGYVLRAGGGASTATAYLLTCLIADNSRVDHELILGSNGPNTLALDNCTLTHNAIGAARVIAANDTLYLNDSIIDSGSPALVFSGNPSNLGDSYNLAGNASGLTTGTTNTQGSPAFVDPSHGDYRLFYGYRNGTLIKSPGIDYAPPVTGDDRDIRGMPRDQVITSPFFGDRDLGAYEMQGVGDRIFIATFGDDVLLVQ